MEKPFQAPGGVGGVGASLPPPSRKERISALVAGGAVLPEASSVLAAGPCCRASGGDQRTSRWGRSVGTRLHRFPSEARNGVGAIRNPRARLSRAPRKEFLNFQFV